jgi:CheY-like chemotaxis protein
MTPGLHFSPEYRSTQGTQKKARQSPPAVLVVDDADAVRAMLGAALQSLNVAAHLAASGQEALHIYERNAVDLVLMDVLMPEMDGPETLAALKKIDAGVTCVFMSGNPGKYGIDGLLSGGATAVIQKPFGLDLLRLLMKEFVPERASQQSPGS